MAGQLRTEPGIESPDDFYARLIELHEGLSSAESHKINAKVILMLANHVGDVNVLYEVLEYAQKKEAN